MKGLFIKDLAYLKQNKVLYAFLIVFGFGYSFVFENPYFILGYYSIFAGVLVSGTLTYDDMNHGLSFIFTLPTARKNYIKEKYYLGYFLSFILSTTAFIVATISLFKITNNFHFIDIDWIEGYVFTLLFSILITSLLLPIQIKFGSEKGQYAMFIVFGGVGVIAICIYLLSNFLNFDIIYLIDQIFAMNDYLVLAIFMLIVFIINFISIKISTLTLERKEF